MGIFQSKGILAQSYFIPKPTITPDDIPSQTGKVFIVTGGNSGIGFQTTLILLSKGARVYIASRSREKSHAAIAVLQRQVPGCDVRYLELNLADLRSCIRAAKEFEVLEDRLDCLFNNGGVSQMRKGNFTEDGYEIHLGTNLLGHFTFTTHLLPLLLQTAKSLSSEGQFVKILNTSSFMHTLAPTEGICFRDINLPNERVAVQYAQSKLGIILFSKELSKRYKQHGIFSASFNPGNIDTNLLNSYPKMIRSLIKWIMLYPVALGAITGLYLATWPSVTLDESGTYWIPWARKGETNHPVAEDEEVAKRLWEWCEGEVERVESDGFSVC